MRRLFPNNTFVEPQLPNPKRDLVRIVIGEAPGEEESIVGQPFTGGAGNVLNRMLSMAGIDRSGLTITNCIQCRPPRNVFPTDSDAKYYISKQEGHQAVEHCLRAHVEPLLRSRDWNRVDLLGAQPLKHIADVAGGIFKWRGSPLYINRDGIRLKGIATLHPAFLMRDQNMFPIAVNDLAKSLEEPPEFYNPFPSLEDVKAFRFPQFSFDIECPDYGVLGDDAPVTMVGLCGRPSHAMVVPVSGAYIPELKRIFAEAKSVIGFNLIQFDLPKLEKIGITISKNCEVWDVMLMHHLCFPQFGRQTDEDEGKSTQGGHGLAFVASQFLSKPAWKDDKTNGWEVYCARDTDNTLQCFYEILPILRREKMEDLYKLVQVPLARICNLMSETGITVDPSKLQEVREKFLKEAENEEKFLPEQLRTQQVEVRRRLAAPNGTLGKSGKPVKYILVPHLEQVVPWRSPSVKQRYLYSKDEPWQLGLEPIKDPKTEKITTGKMALDRIYNKTKNRAVLALKKLNQIDEMLTTFLKEELGEIHKVHASFLVHGTSTGRLSSTNPNMQNIPDAARCMYVPSVPGWKLISVDFSGIENRLQSYFAGDTERTKRLELPGFSEHKYLAAKLTGTPMEEITKSIDPDSAYSKAKHVVHGVDRGLGPLKASRMYGMDLKETKKLFELWKQEIKRTVIWQEKCAEQARKQGFLENPFGRRGYFYTSSAYTESLSFPPQSSGADIIFRSMIGLMYERIGWPEELVRKVVKVYSPLPEPANLLLSVHDELVFECPADMVDQVVEIVSIVMGQPWYEVGGMVIPLGINVGDDWGNGEKWKKS